MAIPAFGVVFGAEVLRVVVGWPRGNRSLRWVGAALAVPTAFAVPAAVSMRLDPTVPQAAMIGLVFLLPVLTLAGLGVLAAADRWLRARPPAMRWAGLVLLGIVVGGALPAGLFVRAEVQEARVQEARQAVLDEAEKIEERWRFDVRVSDAAPAGPGTETNELLVRAGDSVLTVGPDGDRRQSVHLARGGLPFPDPAQLDADAPLETIAHGRGFNDTLRAFDDDGTLLWAYATPQGTLGSVAAADVDADGRSEVAAGSTTGAGLRLLSPTGRVLWADTTLWVSDVRTAGARVFAATGDALLSYRTSSRSVEELAVEDTLRLGTPPAGFVVGQPSGRSTPSGGSTPSSRSVEAGMVSSAGRPPLVVAGAGGPELVAATASPADSLAGVPSAVGERWRRALPASGAALALGGRYLAAVGEDTGRVYVFDCRTGAPVGATPAGRTYRGAAWTGRGPRERLVAWTDDTLVGLRLPEDGQNEGAGAGR
jgi:hypothetical protein